MHYESTWRGWRPWSFQRLLKEVNLLNESDLLRLHSDCGRIWLQSVPAQMQFLGLTVLAVCRKWPNGIWLCFDCVCVSKNADDWSPSPWPASPLRVLNLHHQASPVSRTPSMPPVDTSYIPPVPPLIQDYRPYYHTPNELSGNPARQRSRWPMCGVRCQHRRLYSLDCFKTLFFYVELDWSCLEECACIQPCLQVYQEWWCHAVFQRDGS